MSLRGREGGWNENAIKGQTDTSARFQLGSKIRSTRYIWRQMCRWNRKQRSEWVQNLCKQLDSWIFSLFLSGQATILPPSLKTQGLLREDWSRGAADSWTTDSLEDRTIRLKMGDEIKANVLSGEVHPSPTSCLVYNTLAEDYRTSLRV